MWEGDSLSVLLFLLGTAIAGVMGAIVAPSGWRANTLWGVTAVFALSAIGWLIAPTANPVIAAVSPYAIAVAQSGIWVMVGTVAIVAVMIGGRRPVEPEPTTPDAPTPIHVARARQNAIDALRHARDNASIALAMSSAREREKAVPGMRAALLTAHKNLQIPLLPEAPGPAVELETGRRLIDEILPFLREGHVEEARKAAETFVARLTKS